MSALTAIGACLLVAGFLPTQPTLRFSQRSARPALYLAANDPQQPPQQQPKPARQRPPRKPTYAEQQAAMLARMQELEARVIYLEAERSRTNPIKRLGRAVGSHVKGSALMLTGNAPLPGMRRLRNVTRIRLRSAGSANLTEAEMLSGIVEPTKVSPAGLTLPGLPTMPDVSVNLSQTTQAVSFALGNSAQFGVDLARNVTAPVVSPVLKGAQNITSAACTRSPKRTFH